MRYGLCALALATGLGLAGAAAAEPWTDWIPRTGAAEVVTLKVDPNHIDDYLTGLRKAWVPGQEQAKAHGIISAYFVSVKLGAEGGPNVQLITIYPSLANLEPDKARYQAMRAEALKTMSDEQGKSMVAGFDKYRTFVSDDFYTRVDFPK